MTPKPSTGIVLWLWVFVPGLRNIVLWSARIVLWVGPVFCRLLFFRDYFGIFGGANQY